MVNIGRNIKELRKKKGFSQAELGQKLGVSQKVISAYERNYRLPPSSLIPYVAEMLETSTDALYNTSGDDSMEHRLRNPELWKIVELLEKMPRSELKNISRLIEKYTEKKGKKD